MPSPESLLIDLGSDPTITALVHGIGPLIVPFETLTEVDGWLVDPGADETTAPFDNSALSPDQRAVNALLVATDYATRRGAATTSDLVQIARRESPAAVLDGGPLSSALRSLVERLGVGGECPAAFKRRGRGHDLAGVIVTDPALSFEKRSLDRKFGDNALSSLFVHAEGQLDQVQVTGQAGSRWAVEVGLPANVSIDLLDEIEREVALMPSFLHNTSSYLDDDGIVVAWRHGHRPDPNQIGVAIHAWTKALFDLDFADVHIVFAPTRGKATILTEMRARAAAHRQYRDAMRSAGRSTGEPDGQLENAREVE